MRFFRREVPGDLGIIHALATMDLGPEPDILNRTANVIDGVLDQARGDRLRLEDEIADRQERLRQTIVAIEAFEAAAKHLDDGYDRPAVALAAAAE
ncbi:hypothetical protein NKH61_05310 [Mesorhizobium sp. M1005]|uniref:hypothetical protein n=1 Tax=unclassified Mesorhizobium TaxID=325217 RepID=UPI00333CFA30